MASSKRYRVLLADDSAFVTRLVEKTLQDSEFALIGIARDGDEAIEMREALKPDILLLDIVMPRRNGIEVLKVIRPLDPALKIIMLSSVKSKKEILACRDAGVNAFVTKPFQPSHLLATLRRLSSASTR